MAEFVQRMKDWQRMCGTMQGGIRKCDNCPLFKVLCQYKPNEKVDFAWAEQIIEKWAAEHPEPVYPTWGEWLESFGVVEVTKAKDRIITVMMKPELLNSIPADIAQKLGIEPKEG